jgi:predicted enzyme related to lactoylglutathione lyase
VITHVSYVSVPVADQDRALDFYLNKVGFELHSDISNEGFRWLSVRPRGAQTAIVLYKPWSPDDPQQPGRSAGIVFHSDDIQRTYEEMSARGVTFTEVATRQPWGGMQAQFDDIDGNHFVLTDA